MIESTSGDLHQVLLDVFTMEASSGSEKMAVSDLLSYLQRHSSVKIDREALMQLIDLDSLKMVKSLEGDWVYFNKIESQAKVGAETAEKRKTELVKSAVSQASKLLNK